MSCNDFPRSETCICTKPGLTRTVTTMEKLYEITQADEFRGLTGNFYYCCGDMVMGGLTNNYNLPYVDEQICRAIGWSPDEFQTKLRNCWKDLYARHRDGSESSWNYARPTFRYNNLNHIECPRHWMVTKIEMLGRVSYICVRLSLFNSVPSDVYKNSIAGTMPYMNIYGAHSNPNVCGRANTRVGTAFDLCTSDLTRLTPPGSNYNPTCDVGIPRCGICPAGYGCANGICTRGAGTGEPGGPQEPGTPEEPGGPQEPGGPGTPQEPGEPTQDEGNSKTIEYVMIIIGIIVLLFIIAFVVYLLI